MKIIKLEPLQAQLMFIAVNELHQQLEDYLAGNFNDVTPTVNRQMANWTTGTIRETAADLLEIGAGVMGAIVLSGAIKESDLASKTSH